MAKKSRQRKLPGKRPAEAPDGKTVALAAASHKPWQIAAVCIVLATITAFAFRGVRNNDFLTYDDSDYVQQNLNVRRGLTPQSRAWTFAASDRYLAPANLDLAYRGLELYGNNPRGHHLTNL